MSCNAKGSIPSVCFSWDMAGGLMWLCVALVVTVHATPLGQTRNPTSVRISRESSDTSPRVLVTRNAGWQKAEKLKDTNCHESSFSVKSLDYASDTLMPVGVDEETAKFCYFRFLNDDISFLGTLHRPALSEMQMRSSMDAEANDLARFGKDSSYQLSNSYVFGDPQQHNFYDTQGYILHAIPTKPFLKITGSFNGTVNTRPLSENQIVSWKIVYSPTGDIEAVSTIQQGQFTLFRKSLPEKRSVFAEGKVDIEPIHLQGFEDGWIGLIVKVRYVDVDETEAKSVYSCEQLGWKYYQNAKTVCAESRVPVCHANRTFHEAKAACQVAGGRLCTWNELNMGYTKGSGCSYDLQLTWTSSPCTTSEGKPGAWAQAGNPILANGELGRACFEIESPLFARCCADKDNTVQEPSEPTFFMVDDSSVKFQFSEPPHPNAYADARATYEKEQVEEAVKEEAKEASSGPVQSYPMTETKEAPVGVFDFNLGTAENQANNGATSLDFIGTECDIEPQYAKSIVQGRERTVMRFDPGTGFLLRTSELGVNMGENTAFSIAFMAKFDHTSCHVRLLNVNPGEDGGVYMCDGIVVTPEVAAGSPVSAMEWNHLVITTQADRHTSIYVNGALVKAWKPGRRTWVNGLSIQTGEIILFNDCGNNCGCESHEQSGGWLAALHVYNYAIDEGRVATLMASFSSGLISDYDLTTAVLENGVDNGLDIIDIGEKCGKPTYFVTDPGLRGASNHQVLVVPAGSGISLSTESILASGLQLEFTLLVKFKLAEAKCGSRVVTLDPESGVGIDLCGGLRITSSGRTFGPPIRSGIWYTLTISTSPSRETRFYLNSRLVHEVALENAVWDSLFQTNSERITLFSNSHSSCDNSAVSTDVSVSRIQLFDRVLAYDEIQYYVSLLGSEIKVTLDPGVFGGTAPEGSICSFPFVIDDKVYTECSHETNMCKVSGDIDGAGGGQYSWGMCSPSSGYLRHPATNIPASYDIGPCRGGLKGCEQLCDSLYDCVGFTLDSCANTPVHQHLLSPIDGSTVTDDEGVTIVGKPSGSSGGAQITNIPVTVGTQYILIVVGFAQRSNTELFISDAGGNLVQDRPELPVGQKGDAKELRMEFTARHPTVIVGVRFTSGSTGDTASIVSMDLPTRACDGYTGAMAIGQMKGMWLEVEETDKHHLYQKLRQGPIAHIEMTSLKNRLHLGMAINNMTLVGSHLANGVDIGRSCDAGNEAQTLDTRGLGGDDSGGFSLLYGKVFRDFSTTLIISLPECLKTCSESSGCKGVSWDPKTVECKLASGTVLTGASDSVSGFRRSLGSRFFRVRQTSSSSSQWQVNEIDLFTSFGLESSASDATVTVSSGESGDFVSDGNNMTSWTANSVSDEWVQFDFGTHRPTIRSMYTRSVAAWPTDIVLEESTDGTDWFTVMTIDDFAIEYFVDVVGVASGLGGNPKIAMRLKRGSGLAIPDVDKLIPGSAQTAWTTVMQINIGNTDSGSHVLLDTHDKTGNGLFSEGNRLKLKGSQYDESGGTPIRPFTWTRIALSVNSNSWVSVNLEGNMEFSRPDSGSLDLFELGQNPNSTIRLFNDGGEGRICTSGENVGTTLVSDLLVYSRPMSDIELEDTVEGMRERCGGITGECNNHGYCREGRCICDRAEDKGGWKGETCENAACPGIPECNLRGACGADGTCECTEGFTGESCEFARCPNDCAGVGDCSYKWKDSTCTCPPGYRSADCSIKICPGDYEDELGAYHECNGNGACNDGMCQCEWFASPAVAGYKVKEVSEGGSIPLKCDSGFIHIQTARYGADDRPDLECHADNSLLISRRGCEGKVECSLAASNGLFGDPCGGRRKMLRVSYSCVSDTLTLAIERTDCSLTLPTNDLLMSMNAETHANGQPVTTQGSSGAQWRAASTQTRDNVKSFSGAITLEVTANPFTFPQHYSVAYWVNFLPQSGNWRTLLRGTVDHQVIVYPHTEDLGMYSNRLGGFHGAALSDVSYGTEGYTGAKMAQGWHMLYTSGSGDSPTSSTGTQRYQICTGGHHFCHYSGVSPRAVSGTNLYRLGWPGQDPGHVSHVLVWSRHLSGAELFRVWDFNKRRHGLHVVHIGCYNNPALANLESDPGVSELLSQPYASRSDPIECCARAARRKGHLYFAVKDGGACSSGQVADERAVFPLVGTDCGAVGSGGELHSDAYKIVV